MSDLPVRLGKHAPKITPQTFRLADYLDVHAVEREIDRAVTDDGAPTHHDWETSVPAWPMLGNDQVGDCVVAAALHYAQMQAAVKHDAYTPTDADAIPLYYTLSGGTGPAPASWRDYPARLDQGLVIADALSYLRKQGVIGAYATIPIGDTQTLHAADYVFGGIIWGFALPLGLGEYLQQHAFQGTWSLTNVHRGGASSAPGSWGGHCVVSGAYSSTSETNISWGQTYRQTAAFRRTYADEAWVAIAPEWLKGGATPAGFNAERLAADLAALPGVS